MTSPSTDPEDATEPGGAMPDPPILEGDLDDVDPSPPGTAAALPESDAFAELQAEVLQWRDVALRAKADLENFRKRIAREKADAIRFANADLLRSLLPILDNFEWGLEAARQESETSSIFQGMQMVRRQIEDFLAAEGAVPIDAVGRPFDPNQHEAVSQETSDSVPEGTVISQSRRGFQLGDRLLRPAAVVVSAGPAGSPGNAADDAPAGGSS